MADDKQHERPHIGGGWASRRRDEMREISVGRDDKGWVSWVVSRWTSKKFPSVQERQVDGNKQVTERKLGKRAIAPLLNR